MLASLCAQEGIDWNDFEVLVIDNRSTDGPPKSFVPSRTYKLPLRGIFEECQGLSHARNRAVVRECRSEFLLFTDDDVRLEPDWLAAFSRAVEAQPRFEIFGGRIRADWHGARPGWLQDENMALLRGAIVSFDLGEENRPYGEGEEGPIGASMGLRRAVLERVGGFDTELGQIGKKVGRGEESDFITRALARGARRFYVGEALLWHWVDNDRLSLSGLWHFGIGKGRSHKIERRLEGSLVRALTFLLRGLFQLAKGRGDRFRQCVINAGVQVGAR